MKFPNLNHHEKHIQHTKYSLLWGFLNHEWFNKGHYDVSSKTNGSLHLNNDQGRIKMSLGLDKIFLGSSV